MNRLDALVESEDSVAAADIPMRLQVAGDRLLAQLLQPTASSRDSALDLLAVDALMTYMMESAAENVGTLGLHAEAAMSRISEILEASPASA